MNQQGWEEHFMQREQHVQNPGMFVSEQGAAGPGGLGEVGQDQSKQDLVRQQNVILIAVRFEDFKAGIECNSLWVILLLTKKIMRNLKVESQVLFCGNVTTVSLVTPREPILKRWGGARLYKSLQQGAGNLNIKRLLLRENKISHMKSFRDLLCMGRCKHPGLLNHFFSMHLAIWGQSCFLYCSRTNSLFTIRDGKSGQWPTHTSSQLLCASWRGCR